MNIFESVSNEIGRITKGYLDSIGSNLTLGEIVVELPKDASHGDLATNIAMILAPKLKQKPRELAESLLPAISEIKGIDKAEIAGPGFINLKFKPGFWQALLPQIISLGSDYGATKEGAGKKINVEYVSANPTGPLHVGHARGAVVGDVIASMLEKCGYDVTREYYINDAGGQVEVLVQSALLRYREALGVSITIPEGLYPGDYLIPIGQLLKEKFGDSLLTKEKFESESLLRSIVLEEMMKLIRSDLELLGVKHNVFFSEKSLHDSGGIDTAISELEKLGHIYNGVLEPPKGKAVDDWEPREQTLFRSTEFGDDVDRPLKKSNGDYTYFAADIAYHADKFRRGFSAMLDVWGADHGGYVKRMKAATKAVTNGQGELEVLLTQLVNLTENGSPVKMSKRSGSFITLCEVVEELGAGVVRFIMLTRKCDAPLDFDLAKAKEMSSDNPYFYVQYAHARACSVIRNAGDNSGAISKANINLLTHPKELAIIKILATWPKILLAAAKSYEPHRVAFYLQELASEFHGFWNLGKEDVDLRFIVVENPELSTARLLLVSAVKEVLASALIVMGVEPLKEMK